MADKPSDSGSKGGDKDSKDVGAPSPGGDKTGGASKSGSPAPTPSR